MTVTKVINGKSEYMEIDEGDARYFGYKGWMPVKKADARVAVKKDKDSAKESVEE